MEHKKRFAKKTIAGIGVCACILGGMVGYGAYNQFHPAQKAQTAKKQPFNPMKPESKEKNSLIPEVKEKSTQISPGEWKEKKEKSEETSLSDFHSTTGQPNLVAERAKALNTLNVQVAKEQKEQERKNTVLSLEHPVAKPSKPETEKPDIPAPKPEPIPIPDPEPEPEPTPDPVPIVVDYTALAALVEQAQKIDLSLYLTASVEQFNVELLISQRLLEELGSSQTAVDNQVTRLQNAIEQLVAKGDKAALRALYDHSKTIQTDIYTVETITSLEQAQKAAEDTLAQEVSQVTVDTVLANLNQAIEGLQEKEEPDLSLVYLRRVVNEAKGLQMSEYSPTTAQVLTDKLTEVESYIQTSAISKEENERLTNELREAINQLQVKADRTQITTLLQTIDSLDRTLYTAGSLQALDSVVANVTSQLDNQNLTQAEADNLYQQLHTAYEQLETVETAEN